MEYKYKLFKLLRIEQIGLKMATNKSKALPIEVQLDAKLSTLQDSCAHEIVMHYQTRQQERENLAQIYYWWQEAYKLPAYYNAKLAHLPPEQLRNTTDKFNFGPVLRLFYGVYGLQDYKRSRLSSALNAMHEEWEAKPELYKQDVAKLANYIDQSKGVSGLAKQKAKIAPAASPDDEILTDIQLDEHEAKQAAASNQTDTDYDDFKFQEERRRRGRPVFVDVDDAQRREALTDEAQDYWRKANGIASFDLDFGIEANKRKYSLALVRVDDDKMSVINTSVDEEIIKSALLLSYRKQLASVPRNLRCVLEVLRTQFVGGKVADQLQKVPELGLDNDGEQVKTYSRLICIPSSNQILLSPIGSKSGLVTTSTPSRQYLNVVDGDFYLSGGPKNYLQRRLIANDDCNQFSVSNVGRVMAMHEAPCVVYVMKLTSKSMPADFAYIDFVSFDKANADSQVCLDDKYIAAIKSKFKINASTMHKLAKQYADKWMTLKGDHASRPENDLCTFAISADAFQFEIFDKNEDIGADPICKHNKKLKLTNPYKHHFKCRDLMVALSGIGALQLEGDVEMLLDSNMLVFNYRNDIASYTTAIPTVNKQTGKRNEKGFVAYKPKPYTSHTAAASHVQHVDDDALTPVYCYA